MTDRLTSGDRQTLGDSQTLEDSQTSPKVGATPKNGGETLKFRKWAPHQKRGGNPEIQKMGGIPKNSGETLKNWRDREIGGSAKNRSGAWREPWKTTEDRGIWMTRNLDDGPSPPPPSRERMKRNERDSVPLATVSNNQPRDGDHGGKKVSLGGTVM